jgi:hypothetical protein
MTRSIEIAFDRAMHAIYHTAYAECDYRATRFLNLVNQLGGLEAARHLLMSDGHSEGLTALWEHGRLDISMEALVLKEPWSQLFTDDELKLAKRRLRRLGYVDLPR